MHDETNKNNCINNKAVSFFIFSFFVSNLIISNACHNALQRLITQGRGVQGDNLSVYNVFVYEPQPPKIRTVTRMIGVVC
jgi:hypothetical protein